MKVREILEELGVMMSSMVGNNVIPERLPKIIKKRIKKRIYYGLL